MAWNFGDGFDMWAAAADAVAGTGSGVWSNFSLTLSSTTRFSTGKSCYCVYNGNLTTPQVTNNDAVHHFALAVMRGTGSGTACYAAFTLYDGTSAQCSISFHVDGTIRLYSGAGTGTTGGAGTVPSGTLLAQSPALLTQAAAWYGVEIEVKIDGSAGYFIVRLNGNTANDYASATTLNTKNGSANAYANKLIIYDQGAGYSTGNSATTWFYMDDLMWFTTSGAAPNTWVGDVRCVSMLPSSDQTLQFTPNSGSTGYSRVNSAGEDGDTTYVSSATVGAYDYYGFTALTSTPTAILAIQTKMMMRKDDSNAKSAKLQVKSGTTVVTPGTILLGTSYAYTSRVDTVDPNTSAAWTVSGVNSLQIGPYVVA